MDMGTTRCSAPSIPSLPVRGVCVPVGLRTPRVRVPPEALCPPPQPLPAVVMHFATGCHYGKAVRPAGPPALLYKRYLALPAIVVVSFFPSHPTPPARKLWQEHPKYSSEGDGAARGSLCLMAEKGML